MPAVTDTYAIQLPNPHHLTLHQDRTSLTSATTVWPGGRDLSLHITYLHTRSKKLLTNCTLIDLGCGTGIVGLAAAKFGAKVVLTDMEEVVTAENLRLNIEENEPSGGGTVETAVLKWTMNPDVSGLSPPYDIITGADVLYDMSAAFPLAHTILALCDTKSLILIAYERRDPLVHEAFMETMKGLGFRATKVSQRVVGRAGVGADSLVDIFKFKLVGRKGVKREGVGEAEEEE